MIYQATVSANNSEETYVGLTENDFKSRYRKHLSSIRHSRYRNSTELSKHIWYLKENDIAYNITWKIICKAVPYNLTTKRCNLCLTEKYIIMQKCHNMCSLNKRTELMSTCRHYNKFLLSNYHPKKLES